MSKTDGILSSSFRDPSGFLFRRDGHLYRQVNSSYQRHYDALMNTGLYEALVKKGLLISHEEVSVDSGFTPHEGTSYKVIQPELVSFISYPYEWAFSQLKDAALATLDIQLKSLDVGLTLKDASSYNIQFRDNRPVLIDTLSFEVHDDGQPWIAYRQFCQHFLAPLALMSLTDVRLGQLSRLYIDGVPLDLASRLLPKRSHLKWHLLTHVHLHAKTQAHFAGKKTSTRKPPRISRQSLSAMIQGLQRAVQRLEWQPTGTEWVGYYDSSNYSSVAFDHKRELVKRFLQELSPKSVWDLGANEGVFSRIASELNVPVVAFDYDPAAVEKNYTQSKQNDEKNLLPLVLDLTNPSPGIGWGSTERMSLMDRGPVDTVMALALVHHLAISNNVPLERIARFFKELARSLIIEFVPKSDSQVQRLLATRSDIFDNYHQAGFESSFTKYFHIRQAMPINESERVLYAMEAR